jgi:hypothetical protein
MITAIASTKKLLFMFSFLSLQSGPGPVNGIQRSVGKNQLFAGVRTEGKIRIKNPHLQAVFNDAGIFSHTFSAIK